MQIPSSVSTRLQYQHKSLLDLMDGLSDEQIRRQVNTGKWSIFENIVHLQTYQHTFISRVKKMTDYVTTKNCRSNFINLYFGDDTIKNCGVCDNCLRAKSTQITTEEFEKIREGIQAALSAKNLAPTLLLEKLSGVNKEKARSVLNFLQAEQKITITEKGEISLC